MGLGDDIMYTSFAKKVHEETGKLVTTPDNSWSPMWNNIPYIVKHEDVKDPNDVIVVDTHPAPGNGMRGLRWYLKSMAGKMEFNYDFHVMPSELIFTDEEIDEAKQLLVDEKEFIFINPSIKNTTSADNKDWGWHKWVELVELLKDTKYKLVQSIPASDYNDVSGNVKFERRLLPYTQHVVTENPRIAFAVLSLAKVIVTTEGGASHAAGALGIPGVVIFGGFVPPNVTNYPIHDAVYPDHPLSPCGTMHRSCPHCREVMESISAQEIYDRLMKIC